MRDGKLTLRSYRLAFELERRLHRIDRFRIPVPYGVPLVGLAYGAGAAMVILALAGTPVLGAVLSLVPWPARLILLPAAIAHTLCRTRADGRPAHEALVARALRSVGPRRLTAFEPARAH